MNSWRDNVRKVEPYTPGEQPKEEGVIKLNTNENPYPPSDKIKEAMSGIKNLRKYPDPAATKLVEAIASYHGFDKEEVFVGVGSDDVLAVAFMTFFNGKKPIFFPDITCPCRYPSANSGRRWRKPEKKRQFSCRLRNKVLYFILLAVPFSFNLWSDESLDGFSISLCTYNDS